MKHSDDLKYVRQHTDQKVWIEVQKRVFNSVTGEIQRNIQFVVGSIVRARHFRNPHIMLN